MTPNPREPARDTILESERGARALMLLREWWRLHLLSQSHASTYADYLAFVEVMKQVRELLAEETPGVGT